MTIQTCVRDIFSKFMTKRVTDPHPHSVLIRNMWTAPYEPMTQQTQLVKSAFIRDDLSVRNWEWEGGPEGGGVYI